MLPAALLKAGEQGVNMLYVAFDAFLIAAKVCADAKVFKDGKVWKYTASFGNKHYATLNDFIGGHKGYVLPLVGYGSRRGGYHAHYGAEGGGLACAVGADEGNYLSLVYIKGYAFEGLNSAVVNFKITNFKQTTHPHPPPNKRL